MKTMNFIVALLLALSAPAGQAGHDPTADYPGMPGGDDASKEILVTYVDRSINRASTSPSSNYRRRGHYRSSSWSERIAGELSEAYHLTVVAQWPMTELGVECVVYDVASDASVTEVLDALRHDQRVESAQPMHRFRTMAEAYSDPYYRLQNNIRSMQIEAAQRWATGRHVRIAVIDTGVDLQHPDLKGQVVAHEDFTARDSEDFARDLHGTAVAGVIGAIAQNGTGIVGVAPNAELIALKACWPMKPGALEAECNSLTLLQALNAAIGMEPDILNMSLTGPPDPLLHRMIDRALEKGIVVVASAWKKDGSNFGFPASMGGVIAVGASNQKHDQMATAKGRRCLMAPGVDVLTTLPSGTYDFVSGSSLSAALVSGVIALLLELNPDLTAEQVARILEKSAIHHRLNAASNDASMVNACSAIGQLRKRSTCRLL